MAVIGGGIVGLATAHELSRLYPNLKITLFEKEAEAGRHQTGNNSGVLHAGLYYAPGSFKARLAVSGIKRMKAFCEEEGVAYEVCGKLVVATEQEELPRLDELLRRGQANGLVGLKMLSAPEMREIEPFVAGIRAVRVPEEGIVDYKMVCQKMIARIRARGHEVRTSEKVEALFYTDGGWRVTTSKSDYQVQLVINCGGLHCDRIAKKAGENPEAKIIPFRGEYYMLKPESQHLVQHLIYPVPDPTFPFLGVHFTRMIHGGVEAGPNAVLAFAREGYKKTNINLIDLYDSLTYPGLWKFIKRYPSMARYEIARSFSKRLFCESLQRLIPDIKESDLTPGGAGVRAQAMLRDGTMVQDFNIVESPGAIHILNAPSPGATASLAIGEEIAKRAATQL